MATKTKKSYNNWPHIDKKNCRFYALPGTKDPRYRDDRPMKVLLRPDNSGIFLASEMLWFHNKVERIDKVEWDDHGWGLRPSDSSCHPSATAFDVNAKQHPQFDKNTFTASQENLIQRRLVLSNGILGWGGNWSDARVDEMHFELLKVSHKQVTDELIRRRKSANYPVIEAVMKANNLTRLYTARAA